MGDRSEPPGTSTAKRPRPPALSASARQQQGERAAFHLGRERLERKSVLRGLILLALLVLAISLVRAGTQRAFYPGWWRQW